MSRSDRPYKVWVDELVGDATPQDRVALLALSEGVRLLWYKPGVYHTSEAVTFLGCKGPIMWNRIRLFKNWELA